VSKVLLDGVIYPRPINCINFLTVSYCRKNHQGNTHIYSVEGTRIPVRVLNIKFSLPLLIILLPFFNKIKIPAYIVYVYIHTCMHIYIYIYIHQNCVVYFTFHIWTFLIYFLNFNIRHPRRYVHAKEYFTVIVSTVTTNTYTCETW
jgi:hypothetical protein